MIETTKSPYEFLVRWREGKIAGAHVGFELTTKEDGVVISVTPLPVMAVNIGQGVGFPLADILEQLQIDALVARDAIITERDTLVIEKQELLTRADAQAAELAELKKSTLQETDNALGNG
jgi:hypothetical protein